MIRRDVLTGLLLTALGCRRKQQSTLEASPDTSRSRAETFVCPRCGQSHKYGEPGFNWPDAHFALALSEGERLALSDAGNNEDVATVRDAHFVRGVLFVPVKGWSAPLGIGLWIRLATEDYLDFERRNRADHPVYTGTIANQATFLGPTLGLSATMVFVGAGQRPALRLIDPSAALAQAQSSGVTAKEARRWLAETVHDGEAEPMGPPRTPELQKDGYRLITASDAGRQQARARKPASPGDKVKVVVEFLGSDEKGMPKPIVAGWWLTLDEVRTSGPWSGTLANVPRLPAPISHGARFWVGPEHIIEFE